MDSTHIEKLRVSIETSFKSGVSEAFKFLADLQTKIEEAKKTLSDTTAHYVELKKENDRIKADTAQSVSLANKAKSELKQKEDEMVAKTRTNENQLAQLVKDIESSKLAVERLKSEYESVKSELAGIEPLKLAKESLESELKDISLKVNEAKEKSKEIESSHKAELESILSQIKKAKEELESIKEENSKQIDVIRPKIEELHEREKAIVAKEDGLKTIEERWKRIYAEKGASFKL